MRDVVSVVCTWKNPAGMERKSDLSVGLFRSVQTMGNWWVGLWGKFCFRTIPDASVQNGCSSDDDVEGGGMFACSGSSSRRLAVHMVSAKRCRFFNVVLGKSYLAENQYTEHPHTHP